MRVYVSDVLSHPVDTVWRLVGDFHSMAGWVPTLTHAEAEGPAGVGSIRVLHRQDGGVVRERLVGQDDRDRRLCYEFAGPHRFAVRDYRGTIQLRPVTSSGGTFLEWYADFDVDTADEDTMRTTFESIFVALIGALRRHLDADASDG